MPTADRCWKRSSSSSSPPPGPYDHKQTIAIFDDSSNAEYELLVFEIITSTAILEKAFPAFTITPIQPF